MMTIQKIANQDTGKSRIQTLDSLRGLAALTVVIAHCSGNINYNQVINITPLHIFLAANEAVIFFFLLSGYVLVYQYESKRKFKYGEFLTLRICRIYIPYIVSMLFCFILYFLLNSNYTDKTFFGSLWNLDLDAKTIINHIVLISNFNTGSFNPVIWSLVHEMRIAIIFPLLLLLISFKPSISIFIGMFIALLSAFLIVININPSEGYYSSWIYTSYYFYIFMAGGLIAKNQASLLLKYNGLQKWQQTLLIITALIVYTYAHKVSSGFKWIHIHISDNYSFIFEDLLTTIAAFCFIVIAIQKSKKRTFLDSRVSLFLGKISYSLYLIHVPILIFLYKEFQNKLPIFAILLLGVTISIILSQIFNLLIERNATRLGKRLLAKVPWGNN